MKYWKKDTIVLLGLLIVSMIIEKIIYNVNMAKSNW